MCNHITKEGVKCKLSPKKDICHIHKKYLIIDHKSNEIKNLNRTIIRTVGKNKSLKQENERLKNEIDNNLKIISSMKEDYEKYNVIKQFEIKKAKLRKHVVDITDIYELKSFCRSKMNEPTLSVIFGKQDDYWKYYNELRIQRNRLCHEFIEI